MRYASISQPRLPRVGRANKRPKERLRPSPLTSTKHGAATSALLAKDGFLQRLTLDDDWGVGGIVIVDFQCGI
jgi:hypothetical protein